jgi:hypothetical protein
MASMRDRFHVLAAACFAALISTAGAADPVISPGPPRTNNADVLAYLTDGSYLFGITVPSFGAGEFLLPIDIAGANNLQFWPARIAKGRCGGISGRRRDLTETFRLSCGESAPGRLAQSKLLECEAAHTHPPIPYDILNGVASCDRGCPLWRVPCREQTCGTTACRGPRSTSGHARRVSGSSG